MKTNTAQMIGALIQSRLLLDKPYEFVANTTLNERFEVQSGVTPNATERVALRYFAIGNGGHRNQVGADGQFYTTEELHETTDMSCFKPIPFLIRPVASDISAAERAKYGLRVIETISGQRYVVYYLRALDTTRATPEMLLNLVSGNDVTSRPFVPTRDNLFPVAKAIPTGTQTAVSGEYGSVSTVLEAFLTATDVEEIIEACRIKYNNPAYAVISELAMVAAAQRSVKGPGLGNTQIDYVEALCASVLSILITYHHLPSSSRGVKETLEMGTTEPTLLNTSVS